MAPTRSKKRKSTESTSSIDVQSFPAPPQLVPMKLCSPARTPTARSPIKKSRMGITLGQKQALIDNLQLEITERARKLRAQYMLQAQGLRTRIEIRVNRIPMAIRRANMGELLLNYSENATRPVLAKAQTSPAKLQSPSRVQTQQSQKYLRTSPSPQRRIKRLSDEISSADKENEDIEYPKKRPRGPPVPPARTTSKIQPSEVLSPRSANSRTLPRSPIRPAVTPGKSNLARPVSPLKPTAPVPAGGPASILTNMVEKAKSGRGAAATRKVTEQSTVTRNAGRAKRTVPPVPPPKDGRGRRTSDTSEASTSSRNTVVRKPVAAPAAKKAPAKRTVMSTIKGMGAAGKKVQASKATVPVTGTRILRKRN
ncbi:hypothetical protein D0Z07_5651 [Hyphodiscus hymeniophilus]|uniref:Borealin N-terminal domain-containing protein n=1 Tax=Hyphodiscus hymeniophilus TaxID=353542 RepID=A0A9P6VHX4_9HELO|nr:hypothetical protein D0Z07_5651 [Hyphodiscus hymeniophilus]